MRKRKTESRKKIEGGIDSLPPGVKLIETIKPGVDVVTKLAWTPDGTHLIIPGFGFELRTWGLAERKFIHKFPFKVNAITSAIVDPTGELLIASNMSGHVNCWNLKTGKLAYEKKIESGSHTGTSHMAFNEDGSQVAFSIGGVSQILDAQTGRTLTPFTHGSVTIHDVSYNRDLKVFYFGCSDGSLHTASNSEALRIFPKLHEETIYKICFDSTRQEFVTASADKSLRIWKTINLKMTRELQGHSGKVNSVTFNSDFSLLASKSQDGSVRFWNPRNGECLATITGTFEATSLHNAVFHPTLPLLAVVGSDSSQNSHRVVHLFEIDYEKMLGIQTTQSVNYCSAKVVLLGEQTAGKTGLGWRLAHNEYKSHDSTHGQQFWLLKQLSKDRSDGTRCEAVLWDLAGQDDYRLIHALFLDNVDLALLVFDASREETMFSSPEYWLKQLTDDQRAGARAPTILIAARIDVSVPKLTVEQAEMYCKEKGIDGYVRTSAKDNIGIDELVDWMQKLIPWESMPTTTTTKTFDHVKDFVLSLKETAEFKNCIISKEELRKRLTKSDGFDFTDDEMMTAVEHVSKHGYVSILCSSKGERRILLRPDLLNIVAASFINKARSNERGLGALEEQRLLSGNYEFNELKELTKDEREILIDSAAALFLQHKVCFRETDPTNRTNYLVFPDLINLNRPMRGPEVVTEDGVGYTVSGAVENVYASLVVLMGYTQLFTRTDQWRNHARYEVAGERICGFRLDEERPGEIDLVLYFGENTPIEERKIFEGYFERFLTRPNIRIDRQLPLKCPNGDEIPRTIIRDLRAKKKEFLYCPECGAKVELAQSQKPLQLSPAGEEKVDAGTLRAERRAKFEEILFRIKTHVGKLPKPAPSCFISYSWGDAAHERWVEKELATDIEKAGIPVILDRWDNSRPGTSVPLFVSQVQKCDLVLVIGTPRYREKYEGGEPMGGYVVAAEADLIGHRIIKTGSGKSSVMPILRSGSADESFPTILHGKVFADFRNDDEYFAKALELLLIILDMNPRDSVFKEFQNMLGSPEPVIRKEAETSFSRRRNNKVLK